MKKIWAVVVNFNGGEEVIKCIKSVISCQLSIIVVDNGSTDESVRNLKTQISKLTHPSLKLRRVPLETLAKWGKTTTKNLKLRLIENKENLGFAGGVNIGIKRALREGAEYVLLLNQDAIVEEDSIDELISVMKQDKEIGICGPLIYTPEKTVWSAGGEIDKKRYSGGHLFRTPTKEPYEVDFVSGCAMMVKKRVFEKVGFFDERFFLYYEDVDFCIRTQKAGFKVVCVPKAIVYHKVSDRKKKKIRQYFMARNHLLFVEKNAPLLIKLRELTRLPKTILEHFRRKEKWAILGIKDFLLRKSGMKKRMTP